MDRVGVMDLALECVCSSGSRRREKAGFRARLVLLGPELLLTLVLAMTTTRRNHHITISRVQTLDGVPKAVPESDMGKSHSHGTMELPPAATTKLLWRIPVPCGRLPT